jgi:hypothetical protein
LDHLLVFKIKFKTRIGDWTTSGNSIYYVYKIYGLLHNGILALAFCTQLLYYFVLPTLFSCVVRGGGGGIASLHFTQY